MEQSGRLFRMVVMVLTLAGCVWLLEQAQQGRASTAVTPMPRPEARRKPHSLLPRLPIEVNTLPFAALDNTCLDGTPEDLSGCTGWLSGAEVCRYRIAVSEGAAIEATAQPRDAAFDVSMALYSAAGVCAAARDSLGAGGLETMVIRDLEPALYELRVGGYADHCGAYLLTVRQLGATPAQIASARVDPGRNGTVVRWTSFGESGVSYFLLYRTGDGGRQRIAALRARGTPGGFADYRFNDRGGREGATYEIELVTRNGMGTMNFPLPL